MSSNHTVQQGEYLANIAATYGLSQQTIWDDPGNARLKQKRQNLNGLLIITLIYFVFLSNLKSPIQNNIWFDKEPSLGT